MSRLTHTVVLSDTALIQELVGGSEAAFGQLYRAHVGALYAYGRVITRDKCLIEDAAHQVLLQLWAHRERLGGIRRLRAYLLRSMRNELLAQLRAHRSEEFFDFEEAEREEHKPLSEAIVISAVEPRETNEMLLRALNHLPARQREMLFLRYYSNLDYDEIAGMLSLEKRTLYNAVNLAIKRLKDILSKYDEK